MAAPAKQPSSLDDMRSIAVMPPAKRNARLLHSVKEIYARDATQLPLDKDLPRLVGKICVYPGGSTDDAKVTFSADQFTSDANGKSPTALAIAALFNYLSEQLDPGDVVRELRQSCEEKILRDSTGGESHTRLVRAIKDMLQDDKWVKLDTPSLSVVRALNQSIVAPPWSMLKLGFGEAVPFVNNHNSWQIEIRLPSPGSSEESHLATITHSMSQRVLQSETSEETALAFKWVLELDVDTSKAELIGLRFDLADLQLSPDTPLPRARKFKQALEKYALSTRGLDHPEGLLQTAKATARRWAEEQWSKKGVRVGTEVACAVGAAVMAAMLYHGHIMDS